MRGARKSLPQVLKVAGRRPSAGQHENDQTRRARRVAPQPCGRWKPVLQTCGSVPTPIHCRSGYWVPRSKGHVLAFECPLAVWRPDAR